MSANREMFESPEFSPKERALLQQFRVPTPPLELEERVLQQLCSSSSRKWDERAPKCSNRRRNTIKHWSWGIVVGMAVVVLLFSLPRLLRGFGMSSLQGRQGNRLREIIAMLAAKRPNKGRVIAGSLREDAKKALRGGISRRGVAFSEFRFRQDATYKKLLVDSAMGIDAEVFLSDIFASSTSMKEIQGSSSSNYLKSKPGSVPKNWVQWESLPGAYHVKIVQNSQSSDSTTVLLQSTGANAGSFGSLMRKVDTDRYAGSKLRYSAWIKTANVARGAGLWIGVNEFTSKFPLESDVHNPIIKDTQPRDRYWIDFDVPMAASSLMIGILLSGTGKVWIDEAMVEVLDSPDSGTVNGKLILEERFFRPPKKLQVEG